MCYQLGILGSAVTFAFTMWKSMDSGISIMEASIRAAIAGVIIMIAMLFIASLIENLGTTHNRSRSGNPDNSHESIDNKVDMND